MVLLRPTYMMFKWREIEVLTFDHAVAWLLDLGRETLRRHRFLGYEVLIILKFFVFGYGHYIPPHVRYRLARCRRILSKHKLLLFSLIRRSIDNNLRLGYYRLLLFCCTRFNLLHHCAPEVAFRLWSIWLRLGLRLAILPLLLQSVELGAMHRVYLVEARVYLVDCYLAWVVLVDYSEYGLVLLLVNSKFLLHFARLRVKQKPLGN